VSTADRRGRPPVDPRLWRHAPAFRRWLVASVTVGLALTVGLIAQATFLATALTDVLFHRADHAALRAALVGLVVATAARAVLAFAAEAAATGAAQRTKTELRAAAITKVIDLGPSWLAGRHTGDLAVTLGHGLDALDDYVGRYLPRLVLAALAPAVLLVWVAHLDLLSAGILVVTLVLLPVFMVLVGQLTQRRVAQRWQATTRLSGQFLDAVEGLATLRAFGRARAQRQAIAAATDDLRRTTMATLQIALLSALVIETLAAVGTALVAVPLGLRLLSGHLLLAPALAILILTPEIYLPLRRASAEFHANTEGAAALDAVFALLDEPDQPARVGLGRPAGWRRGACGERPASRPGPAVEVRGVTVSYPGQERLALTLERLEVGPGEHLGIVGRSGAGKSTLVDLLAGLVRPGSGEVLADGVDIGALGLDAWRARLAWVPQRPVLFSGSVADNLRLAVPHATDAELWAALDVACLAEVVAALPGGLGAELAEHGEALSAGERQRLAIARALVRRHAGLFLLDEPTAHLDPETEAEVVARLRPALRDRGAVIVTHRPRLLGLVDRVVTLDAGGHDRADADGACLLGVAGDPEPTGTR
jgi:thiol reductant ABC exporter CydD subunit